MAASKLNPRMWEGKESTGGFLFKNREHKAANSPDYKGRFYLTGIGWFWLSAWVKEGRGDPLLSIKAKEMSDEDALKWCAPKSRAKVEEKNQTTSRGRRYLDLTDDSRPLPTDGEQSDIPF